MLFDVRRKWKVIIVGRTQIMNLAVYIRKQAIVVDRQILIRLRVYVDDRFHMT